MKINGVILLESLKHFYKSNVGETIYSGDIYSQIQSYMAGIILSGLKALSTFIF